MGLNMLKRRCMERKNGSMPWLAHNLHNQNFMPENATVILLN